MTQNSLLDDVLRASVGAQVVAENHDDSRAPTRRGDPGECHGLRAVNGRVGMMAVGKLPWHGLGVAIDKAATAAEAIKLAGLAWKADKRPLFFHKMVESQTAGRLGTDLVAAEGSFAIVRSDTGDLLGVVGSRYEPIQNTEGFSFLDGLLGQYGAHYETAGCLHGGKKVWMLANMPQSRFSVTANDTVEAYVMFCTSHDGTSAASAAPTGVRIVCNNTFRAAIGKARGKGVRIRHTGSVKQKLADGQRALAESFAAFERYSQQAHVMVNTRLPDVRAYANDVLDAVLDVTAADALKGADALASAIATTTAERQLLWASFDKKIVRRGEVLRDILSRHESERCGIDGIRGTAWAGFNAVTEFADHGMQYKGESARNTRETRLAAASRRFESAIDGKADEMKQVALERALACAQ